MDIIFNFVRSSISRQDLFFLSFHSRAAEVLLWFGDEGDHTIPMTRRIGFFDSVFSHEMKKKVKMNYCETEVRQR